MISFDVGRLRDLLHDSASLMVAADAPAAVATILRGSDPDAELLFIERAERAGDPWSGHLAFPGGKREPHDVSLLHTAVRETEEEVGIRLAAADCLVQLEVVEARSNGYRVAQFVWLVGGATEARTGSEVQATIWVPLGRLARREGAGTVKFVRHGQELDLPCLRFGTRVLWGMTYRMTMHLLQRLGVEVEA